MGKSTLVAPQIDDGRRFVERFAADGNPIQAAFWLDGEDFSDWCLYIVTELVDTVGPTEAYRAVRESIEKLSNVGIRRSDIKVIGVGDRLSKDMLSFVEQRHLKSIASFSDVKLGSMWVDQIIIYPAHVFTFKQSNPMTKEEVGQELLRQMSRGPGILQPSRVTLKDGTWFSGVPFSFNWDSQRDVLISFIADNQTLPQIVKMDEIASVV
jgi:hypothetical protein